MPLEVRQIGIRLDVGDHSAPGQDGDGPDWSSEERPLGASERAAIVSECLEKVLAELRLQSER